MEFAYAVFNLPSPKHFPVWWDPGASYGRSDEGSILEEPVYCKAAVCLHTSMSACVPSAACGSVRRTQSLRKNPRGGWVVSPTDRGNPFSDSAQMTDFSSRCA
jgi:hypothetical protein